MSFFLYPAPLLIEGAYRFQYYYDEKFP